MTARAITLTIISFLLAMGTNAAPDLAPVSIEAMDTLEWTEAAPGVWSAQIGDEDAPAFDAFAGGEPRTDALGQVGPASFPFPDAAVRGEVRGDRVSVRLPLGANEQVYGLGLQFRGINRRGEVWHLRMDHYGNVPGRTHAPVPFYISSKGYGVLFNTARWISVYPGIGNRKDSSLPPIRDRNTDRQWQARPASDAVEATAGGTGMQVLVFAGQSPLDAVRRYNLYFGGGTLPPRWGLGFWHRVPTTATAEQVVAEAAEFEKRDFPLDVIGLEPGWQSKSYPGTFDWDTGRFPDPAAFVSAMSSRNLKVNLWENPYVSPHSSMYDAMEPYTGSHMVWLGLVPDYTIPEARAILTEHHNKTHLDIGVSGYKIDEVDGIDAWLWPDHATFPSGTSGELMRQTYALQLQHMLTAEFRAKNSRTYGLVRGSNAGASAYPWVIYSDYYDHKGYIAALCNSGFAGVLWTPEIRSARSDSEWVRRMQTVCFSPMAMLNAWASGMKPWSKPEVTDIIRDTMKWRLRFLPYLYTAFARYHYEGIPPFRAMALEPGFVHRPVESGAKLDGEKNPYAEATRKDIDDQYMMGDCLLVAPLVAGQKERDVVLPQGKWFDFHTGEPAGEGAVISVQAELDKLPLFVRDGGIIPLMPTTNNTAAWKQGLRLEVRHYGHAEGSTQLYDDDGETFDHEQGEHSWHTLAALRDEQGKLKGHLSHSAGDYPQTFGKVSWRFMSK